MVPTLAPRLLPVLPDNCPPGFYIPDDLSGNNPHVWYVNTTLSNCAVGCIVPFYSDEEWDMLENTFSVSVSIGFVMITMLLLTWIVDSKKKDPFVAILFVSLSCVQSIAHIVLHSIPRQQRFCSDQTAVISADDGWTVCNVHSFVEVYCSLSICLCWMFQAIGVYRKVILNLKFAPERREVAIAFILTAPLASLGGLAAMEGYGYSWGATMCQINAAAYQSGYGLLLVTLPIMVCSAVGVYCMVRVMIRIVALVFERQKRLVQIAVEEQQDQLQGRSESPKLELSPEFCMKQIPEDARELFSSAHQNHESENCVSTRLQSNNGDGESPRADSLPVSSSEPDGEKYFLQNSFEKFTSPKNNDKADASADHFSGESNDLPSGGWSDAWETLIMLRSPLAFTLFFGLLYASIIAFTITIAGRSEAIINSANDWAQCVLTHYDGDSSHASWVPYCGIRPPDMISMSTNAFFTVILSGSSLLCALIHGPGMYSTWKKVFIAYVFSPMSMVTKTVGKLFSQKASTMDYEHAAAERMGAAMMMEGGSGKGGGGGFNQGGVRATSFISASNSSSRTSFVCNSRNASMNRIPPPLIFNNPGESKPASFVVVEHGSGGDSSRSEASNGVSSRVRFESNYQDFLPLSSVPASLYSSPRGGLTSAPMTRVGSWKEGKNSRERVPAPDSCTNKTTKDPWSVSVDVKGVPKNANEFLMAP